MQVLCKATFLAIVPVLILIACTGALALPIRTLPGLQAVTIYEETFGRTPNMYAPNAAQLTTRLADPLSSVNNDFSFFADEYYDVFYSDADGTPNPDGAFLTVEGVWRNQGILLGGMNINEVELTFAGPLSDFGDFVASVVFGSFCNPALGAQCIPGSEALAVDQNLGTFPRFGHTSNTDLNERFRLTIGFNDISDVTSTVPEPSTWVLLASGLVGLLALRQKSVRRTGQ